MAGNWDHTRSPWWNLRHTQQLAGRELVAGTTALVVLLAAFSVAAGRSEQPAGPVITSVASSGVSTDATTGPTSDSTTGAGDAPASATGTDDGAASDASTDATSDGGTATDGTAPGSAGPDGQGTPSGSPSQPGGASSPAPGASGEPAGPAGPAQGPAAPPTRAPVTIGFIRQVGTGENAGFATPNQGDPDGQIKTLVNWMNANGGLNGHEVVPSIRTVDINNTGRPQEEATCRAFTEQDKAFAVVPLAMIYAETRACYAEHQTILFDPTPFPMPDFVYDALAPYIWQTSYPSTSRMVRALAQSLGTTDFFAPDIRLGFVAPDAPYFRQSFEQDAVPAFAAQGVEFAEVAFVQNDSIPNTQSGLQQAAFRFQTQGITHVVFYGNALLAPLFMTNAESNAYFPRYGLTSFDQPKFNAEQWATPASLAGAVGAGFSAAQDVPDAEVAFPAPREQLCLDIYAADGHTWASRNDAKIALGYCDAVFLMMDAAGRLGSRQLTAQHLSDAILELGDGFQAPTSHGSRAVPGRQDLADTYRPMAYDAACDCFVYTGPPVRIPA